MTKRLLLCLVAVLVLGACAVPELEVQPELSSFRVTVDTSNLNQIKGVLLDVPTGPVTVSIDVQALGREGQDLDWSGLAWLKARPGRISGEKRIEIVDGKAKNVDVEFVYTWGDARVWVEDAGEIDTPGTYATGVSRPLPFNIPTVADVQRPATVEYGDESCFSPWGFIYDCAGLAGDFVRMRGLDHGRRLIVTNVTTDGFYATDMDSGVGNYGSIFAFNFSRPVVDVGDMLRYLSGNVAEFIGFTELNYPVWDIASSGHQLPEPTNIAAALQASGATSNTAKNEFLEAYESSPVYIPDATFADDLYDPETFLSFAQWPVRVPGSTNAEFTIISLYEAPQFDPLCWLENHPGESMGPITGHLRHIGPADPEWVLDLNNACSFSETVRNSDCWNGPNYCDGEQRRRPSSGPRLSMDYTYRDLPTCSGLEYAHEHEYEPAQ